MELYLKILKVNFVILFFIMASSCLVAVADDLNLSGHLKLNGTYSKFTEESLQKQSGLNDSKEALGDLRISLKEGHGPFDLNIDGQVTEQVIGDLNKRNLYSQLLNQDPSYFQTDDTKLFDLSDLVSNNGNTFVVARFDRASLGYKGEGYKVKLGRQAISWGQGMAFQALDIFNPFAPASVDKEYKPGDDMVYLTILPNDLTQFEFIYLPRRDEETHQIKEDQSSYGVRLNQRLTDSTLEFQGILANHYGDTVIGAGVNKDFWSSLWRLDAALTHTDDRPGDSPDDSPDDGENYLQLVSNIDRSWEFLDKNWYGFIEYFYSGFGTAKDLDTISALTQLSPALSKRIARGELFTLSESYLSIGVRQEITPLLNIQELILFNINEAGSLLQLSATYELTQNLIFLSALNLCRDCDGSVFGQDDSAFIQVAYYF